VRSCLRLDIATAAMTLQDVQANVLFKQRKSAEGFVMREV